MAGMRTLEENIELLEKANDETREIIREAHETIRTARLALKDLREEREKFEEDIHDFVHKLVEGQVRKGLEDFNDTVAKATHDSYDRVVGEFNKLQNILLYGNEKGKGESLVEAWVERSIQQELDRRLNGANRRRRV